MSLAGVAIIIGGYLLGGTAIRIVYTEKWATESTISIMHWYCVYCLFMGINGITEAYVYALATPPTLKLQQYFSILTSILYISSCILFSSLIGI